MHRSPQVASQRTMERHFVARSDNANERPWTLLTARVPSSSCLFFSEGKQCTHGPLVHTSMYTPGLFLFPDAVVGATPLTG
jgi:hypothetical protein